MEDNITEVKKGIKAKVQAILHNDNNVKDYVVIIKVMRNYNVNITDISIEYPIYIGGEIKISYKYSDSDSNYEHHLYAQKSIGVTFDEFLSDVCNQIYIKRESEKKNFKKSEISVLDLKLKAKISSIKHRRK